MEEIKERQETKEIKEPKEQSKEELHMLYISQMTIQERKAYEIAKEHLETSFNIEKSIGFLQWNKNMKDKRK
jgi:hypothetical protein